jgi:ribokinase
MVCLVVGDANADLSASVDFFPHEGDDAGLSALGFGSGGSAANVAVALTRLGQASRLLARVGNDPAAEVALRAAHRAAVDLSQVQRDPALTTGLCFAVVSPGGERTFFSQRGANVALDLPDLEDVFRDVTFLHVAGHALLEGRQRQSTLALIVEASRRGIRMSVDLCLPLIRARAAEILSLAPAVMFANAKELSLLGRSIGAEGIDATLDALMGAGARVVAAKLGAAGCSVVTGTSRFASAAHPVEVMDTTGAGDGFVAGFLYALLRGSSPEIAARTGNVVGALIASRRGAAEASPTGDEVQRILTGYSPP